MEEGQSLILTDDEVAKVFRALPANRTYPLHHSDPIILGETKNGRRISVVKRETSVFFLDDISLPKFKNLCIEMTGGKFLLVDQKSKAIPVYAFLNKSEIERIMESLLQSSLYKTYFAGFPIDKSQQETFQFKEVKTRDLIGRTEGGLYLSCFFSKVRKKPFAVLADVIKGKMTSFPIENTSRLFDVKNGMTVCLAYENGKFLKSALDTGAVLHFIYPEIDFNKKVA